MSKSMKKWFICCLVLSLFFISFPQMSVWAENTEQSTQSKITEDTERVVLVEDDTEKLGMSEEVFVSVEDVAPYVILADGETLPQTKVDEVSVFSDDVVQLETEDALYQYLKEQVVVRNSQITVSVPVEINNKVGPINAMTSAQEYTEACTGQEGDALKYGGIGYSVSTTSYSDAARVTYTYYMNYYTTAEQEKQLSSAVTSALTSLNLDGKTEAEKVVAIHNYICDHVDYDYDGLSDSNNTVKYTAYGALCNGKAVCNGYAVLFYRMCKEAGLSVRIISGTSNGGSHAWNIVKVGDVYYAVDSTWDGQDAQTLNQYLLKSEKDFSADHTRSAEYTTEEFNDTYPMALNSYYEKNFNDPLNRDNPQYDNVALDGTTVATVSFSKSKILIYFSTQCGYSQATIGEISKNTYTGADIVAVAVNTTSVDDVTVFKNTYGNDDICFAYKNIEDSPTAQNQMWSYVHMNSSATQISFPVIVYIDSNNKIQNVTTGYQALSDIEENMQHYCGVISDGNVYIIKYNPNGGTGDSIRKTYPVSTTAVVEECTYAKDGYNFSGWNTKADGSGTSYKPGDEISNPSSNIVLYAQWNANVTLDNVVLGEFVNTANGVEVNWKVVANAKTYQVYRKTPEGKWTLLTNKETGTTYTDTTAESGKTYYYTVRALNGDMRSPSYDGNKKITCIRALGNVELGEFKNTPDGVQINWKAVANAKTYQVYRKTPEGKWTQLTNKETGTTYTDTTAESGKTYYYTVRALNGDMRSPSYDGNKKITCIRALGNVELGEFKNTPDGIQINWKAVANAKTYQIYRKTPEGKWTLLTNKETGITYTDTTAENGKTYYYTVRALNGDMRSPSYDGNKKITCIRTLGNVELGEFKNTSDGVQINWKAVANAKRYQIYRKTPEGKWTTLTNKETGTTYTDTTAENGKTYYYTVRALNGDMRSPSYDGSRKIECIRSLGNVELGKFTNTSNGVRINWKAVANVKRYQIYRKTPEGKWTTLTNKETGTTYTDTTAENGKTYYYTVRALNGDMRSPSYDGNKKIECIRSLGNVELGEFKNISDGVQINWKAVANAKRYQIYRKTPEGKWTTLTNKETGTTYTDTTAENGKTYYYTVRALNGDMRSPSYDGSKSITYKKPFAEVPQTTFSKTSGNVTFKVQYPENITCGMPTTFKLSSEGTTDKVQYALYSLTTEDGTIVYDTSYGSNGKFFSKDSFDFTFYASGTYYIRFAIMDTGVSPYVWFNTGLYGIKLVIDDKGYPTVENVVADLKAQCEKTCTTDYEKAVWFNDWLVENCRYDFSYSYCAPEGALARGLGTCEAYHRAYVMLLNSVGIATDRISGDGHVWTGVQLDGNWYHIDTTWDDAGYEDNSVDLQHLYFGLNDELMNQIHSSVTSSNGISAHSLEDNYFIKTGKIKKWSDQYVSTIREHLNNGENTFDITINDSMIDSYKQIIYYLVAYQLSNTDWSGEKLMVTYSQNMLHCVIY